MERSYPINEVPNLGVYGRVTKEKGKYSFFWTGSGIECNATGSSLWIEVEVPADVLPPWVCIYFDGRMLSRQILLPGRQSICVYTGLHYEGLKHIRVIKESPAMFDGESCLFSILSLRSDGGFEPIGKKRCRLEIIGDSITSGEGLYGMPGYREWDLWFFTARPEYHYGMQAAERLDADIRIVSQSGWGIAAGYDNCPFHNVPSIYDKVCGVQAAGSAKAAGAHEPYDFREWEPDVVLIHLGTNDVAAFHNPAWKDPESGLIHQMRIEEDGSFVKEDGERIGKAAYDFLCKVRRNNPQAVILWIYGMMKNELEDILRRAVEEFAEKHKDEKIGYLPLTDTGPGEFGAVDHPGRIAHGRAADAVCREIRKWKEILTLQMGTVK